MSEHRDDLSTADLAGQQPADTARSEDVREDDLERADADADAYRSGDSGPEADDRLHDATVSGDRDDSERSPDRLLQDDRPLSASGTADETAVDSAPAPAGGSAGYAAPDAGVGVPAGGSAGYAAPDAGVGVPAGGSAVHPTPDAGAAGAPTTGPLLPTGEAEGFRARWTDVQTGFVDSPRQAVQQADGLTADLMQHLAKTFADARRELEQQWDRGNDVPTDELRTAFQRYRSFFERLLAT